MRPQARIALAIGAVVLAGLVAWVLMPHHATTAQSGSEGSPLPSTPVTSPSTEPVAPATAPADPFAMSLTPTTDPAVPADLPATPPTHTPPDAWGEALDQGHTAVPGSSAFGGRVEGGSVLPPSSVGPTVRSGVSTAKTYTVQANDSLYGISVKVFGSAKYVAAIQKANPKVNPHRLHAGQVINLPEVSTSSTPTLTPTTGVSSTGSETTGSSLTTGKTYKVQPGDSLRKISAKVYGTSAMWQKIYDLNRQTIGSSPSNLRAGMTLRLPEAPASR